MAPQPNRIKLTYKEAFALLRPLGFTPPSQWALTNLAPYYNARYAPPRALESRNKNCAWCDTNKLKDSRRKYCSKKCSDSMSYFLSPHNDAVKGHRLVFEQQCACAICGESYEELVAKKISHHVQFAIDYNERFKDSGYFKPMVIKDISTFYAATGTGDILHVDHIIPIHKGGQGIGFDNIQVICVKCHVEKTKKDRRR